MIAYRQQPSPRARWWSAAVLAVALSLASIGQAAAQSGSTPITLADAISIALKQNGALLEAQNGNAVDAASVRQQRLQFLPSLSLSGSGYQTYGRTFSETTGSVVDQSTQSLSGGISSSLTLFDGLQDVAALHQAQRTEEASSADVTRARQTTAFTVASNYLALVTTQEQLRVQQENLTALEAEEQQIALLVKAGARSISDLYQQQATVASARSTIVTAQRDLELAKVDIIQTLQLDPRGTYDFVPPVVSDSGPTRTSYDLDSLLARALVQRADLTADASRIEASAQGVKVAAASRWPTISLTAGYGTAYNSANVTTFSDQLDQQRGGSIGIGISIPLFDRGASSVAEQKARVAEDNAHLALDAERQQVAADVRRAYLTVVAAGEELSAAQAQLKAADLAVSASKQRYQVGAGTLVELTQAQATQVQAASAVVTARYALVFQQATMAYYTGDLDPARLSVDA